MKRNLLLIVSLIACSPGGPRYAPTDVPRDDVPETSVAEFPAGWKYPAGAKAAFAQSAMVASSSRIASEAGLEVLTAGGNAIDAAVAVGFALAVTYPEAGNIGGGGYMLIRMADGRTAGVDYRETAPLASLRDMFVDSTGRVTNASVVGRAASGVPGAVAGLTAALARYGSMPIEQVIAPAIRLAADGFIVDSALAHSVSNHASLIRRFAGADIFFPGGTAIARGARLRQPELAETLRRIAQEGEAGFYRGTTAKLIAAEMQRDCPPGVVERQRAVSGCGLITMRDLASYRPVWTSPMRTAYRGYTVYGMPPSASGGITIAETLNILEGFRSLPRFGSSEYFHLLASAFQRAFIDRFTLLGDPAFVDIPLERLQSKAHAARLRRSIGAGRATPTRSIVAAPREGSETTHYSVVDAAGNAVATTTTINDLYGSGVVIRGAGFFMNDEMDDFSSQPDRPDATGLVPGEANAIVPGKRMRSSMSPTIVLDPKGRLFLIVGARGGPRIITSTAEVIINIIDHRMSLADALSAPRIHHQASPDTIRYEAGGLESAVMGRLGAMGYDLGAMSNIGIVVAIKRVPGGYEGTDDPRGTGAAVGY